MLKYYVGTHIGQRIQCWYLKHFKSYTHEQSSKLPNENPSIVREIPVFCDNENQEVSREVYETKKQKINRKLYDTHIPANLFQKTFLSIGSAVTSLLDPRRHDMIAVLGETTGYYSLSHIYANMMKDNEGIKILADKPRINSKTVDLESLSKLPEGTLGNAYVKFLTDNQVTPDSRLPVRFVDHEELAYVMQRYREVHDLFHTVLGMPTNMLGEVTVKWIEALQTGLPMCIGGAIFGPIRFRPKQRKKYVETYLPWAFKVGQKAKPLMNIYYEKRWEQNLEDLRNELNIEPPPLIS